MKIGSGNSANSTASTTRRENTQRVELDSVDYGDAAAVQKAREAITNMGLWDTIVDMSRGGTKREALERLADVVLREKAASWQRGGADRVLCEEMAKLDRREVQARFLEMLSPEQMRAILARSEETEEGIRFLPNTNTALDDLLSITFPPDEGKKLSESVDVAVAWGLARTCELKGRECSKEAQMRRSNEGHSEAAKFSRYAAEQFSDAGMHSEAAEAYEQAASDLTAAGWDRTDHSQRLAAAEALRAAAESWEKAGRQDNAENCWNKLSRESAAARLPPELLEEIFKRLPANVVVTAAQYVSHGWNNAASSLTKEHRALVAEAKAAIDRAVASTRTTELGTALRVLNQLPPSLRLEAYLDLLDKTYKAGGDALDDKLCMLAFEVSKNLDRRDQRTVLTKMIAGCSGSFPPAEFAETYEYYFRHIAKINEVEPQGRGPSLVALATFFPGREYLRSYTPTRDLPGLIKQLDDEDPHKEAALIALSRHGNVDALF